MGYLVGNDFIPHLPHVHINQEALPLLWETYKKVLPTLDGLFNCISQRKAQTIKFLSRLYE